MNPSALPTIAAIATPPGRGGIGIIRVSGSRVAEVAQAILKKMPTPRYALHAAFFADDDSIIDEGLALYFPGPNSFTGEDVLELQGHGGPVILDRLLKQILGLGVVMARPGEFSERAFLNGKLDLAQAEAIADLIDASSEQAARSAVRSLQGEFSQRIQQLVEALIKLRMYVEAAIDFPEEEVDFLADENIGRSLKNIMTDLLNVETSAQQGVMLRDGMTVVIAGRPNVGKSSLLNNLSGTELAIVTDIPGTTRDVLRTHIHLDGLPLHIIDTAGLRSSDDPIEQEGMRRAQQEIVKADHVLLLLDASQKNTNDISALLAALAIPPIPAEKLTIIYNKIDGEIQLI